MIIVQLFGGLGNQMFQYAAGRSLAHRLNTQLKLDILPFQNYKLRKYILSEFKILEFFALKEDLRRVKWFSTSVRKRPSISVRNFFTGIYCLLNGIRPILYKKESHFHFDPEFLKLPDDIYLEGYWQSEKYFKDIENIIRREFTLRNEPDITNTHMAEKIFESNAISLHIRRGDYISNPVSFTHHGVCSLKYYHTAIDCMVKNISDPHFYIFSDDPLWVKQNLIVNYPHTYVTHNQDLQDSLDLWLMSMCKHHIIANSSFSWWGAWLSNNSKKIVIAPKKWVNNPELDIRDLIPGLWHLI